MIGLISSLLGCAKTIPPPEGSALLPEIDVVQVKENSDEALKLAQETKLDVEALNSKVTELGNRLSMLADDVANISIAKIEEIENRVALLTEELKALQKMLDGVELKKKQPPPKPLDTFKPAEAAKAVELVPQKIDNITPSLAGGNHEAYQRALRSFNSKDYTNAIKQFKYLLEEDKKGTYADNCTYWIGECFYMIDDYAQAIGWFKKVSSYTDTEKADDAQFKIAKSFMKLGERSQSITEYENLLSLYPSSEYVGRGKEDLQKLKEQE
jgi:TolA-binding protein